MVDHVHLPKFLRYLPPTIPYIARSAPSDAYDGSEFFSFPERRGFSKDDLLRGHFAGRTDLELNEFFQTWLFFGMLYEVLSAAGVQFSLNDFVELGNDGKSYVDTLPLRDHLLNWVEQELVSGAPWLEKVRRIDRCLDRALRFTERLLAPSSPSALHADRLPNVMPEISLSIIILGSTLAGAKDAILAKNYKAKLLEFVGSGTKMIDAIKSGDLPYLPRATAKMWGPAEYTLQKLRQGGWCPKEIEMVKELSDVEMLFFSQLVRPRDNLETNHTTCTSQKCVAFQVDDITYQPLHRDGCPGCDKGVFSTSHVADIVLKGQIPLVRIVTQNGRRQVELGHADDSEYVAISHVWVQGMGNRNANALPMCRLNFIWRLVNSVCGHSDSGTVSFWIDTLCVPLQPQNARRLAITQMKEVYKRAQIVLVLDEELLRVSCNIPNTLGMIKYPNAANEMPDTIEYDFIQSTIRETIMRLFICPWSRRLWTLHEGALAQELMVAFADGIYPFKNIVRSRRNWELLNIPYNRIDAAAMTVASNFLDLGDGHDDHGSIFGLLGSLLCHRETSYLSDEAVCLGGILNLNTADIFASGDTPEARMLEVYRQLPKVPSSLLFLDGPKLATPGFRWAPLSLLGTRLNTALATEALLTDQIVSPEQGDWGGGLFIAAEGVLLERLHSTEAPSELQTRAFESLRLLPTFFVVEHWHGSVEAGREDDLMHVQEVYDNLVTFCSNNLHLPSLKTESLLSTVWRVTYTGSTPWDDVVNFMADQNATRTSIGLRGKAAGDHGNSDDPELSFGLILQPNVQQRRENTTVTRTASLVTNLSYRFMTINSNGSREFKDLALHQRGQDDEAEDPPAELVVSGHFVANLEVEEITPEEWSIIELTMSPPGPDDPLIFRPRSGGISQNWIVR